jgi:hypothetical protein
MLWEYPGTIKGLLRAKEKGLYGYESNNETP